MIKDQRGFSLVEGLLIVLVLSVVGLGGYYVWNQNQKSNAVNENKQGSSQSPDDTDKNQILVNEQRGYSVEIPKGWTGKEQPSWNGGPYNDLKLKSPDYEGNTPDLTEEVTKGASISVWTYDLAADADTLDEKLKILQDPNNEAYYSGPTAYKDKVKKITVAGQEALEYLMVYEGTYYQVEFTRNNLEYLIVLEIPFTNTEDLYVQVADYLDEFETVVNSMKFIE